MEMCKVCAGLTERPCRPSALLFSAIRDRDRRWRFPFRRRFFPPSDSAHFVLEPLAEIAPGMRDPVTGQTVFSRQPIEQLLLGAGKGMNERTRCSTL